MNKTQTPAIAGPWLADPKDQGSGGTNPDPTKEAGRTKPPEEKKEE